MGDSQRAEHIVWESPGGVQMSLIPEPGGSLQIDVRDGVVTVVGKQCRHSQGEDARKPKDVAHQVLAEVHMTIITPRCQITWRSAVTTANT
jgi:hypothetical protein